MEVPAKVWPVLVLAATLAAFAPARAQTTIPVRLEYCQMGLSSMYQSNAALIAARFTNLEKTASSIDFRVWWGDGTVDTVHDVGTFTAGVPIKHNWYVSIGIRQVRPLMWDGVYAYPSRVQYTDGSEWVSPYARLLDDEEYAKEKPLSVRCGISPV